MEHEYQYEKQTSEIINSNIKESFSSDDLLVIVLFVLVTIHFIRNIIGFVTKKDMIGESDRIPYKEYDVPPNASNNFVNYKMKTGSMRILILIVDCLFFTLLLYGILQRLKNYLN